MVVDRAPADSAPAVDPVEDTPALSSFAPKGFLFQAPVGLSSFKFEPLTPRSAGAFLTPRCVPLLQEPLEKYVWFETRVSCCCFLSSNNICDSSYPVPASVSHLSPCSTMSLRLSQVDPLPVNPPALLLLVRLRDQLLQIQAAPLSPNMMCHTSGVVPLLPLLFFLY